METFSKYIVYKEGRIFSKLSKRFLAHSTCRSGYQRVHLINDGGKRVARSVHRLVALQYCKGMTAANNEVNHIDGVKTNNNYLNLEWCTRKHNMQHSANVLGNKHGSTDEQHAARNQMIRQLRSSFTLDQLACAFNVSTPRIVQICSRQGIQ